MGEGEESHRLSKVGKRVTAQLICRVTCMGLSLIITFFLSKSKCFSLLILSLFPCGSAGKESACNAGDLGSIPGLERCPGEGKGYPLQYSGLENPWTVYSPWGRKESDTTEELSLHFFSKLAFIFKLERSLFLTGLICKLVKHLKSPFLKLFMLHWRIVD